MGTDPITPSAPSVASATMEMGAGLNRPGRIVNGPIEVLGNRWILQCTDPQSALFALVGKRSHNGIGYFAPVARKSSVGARK